MDAEIELIRERTVEQVVEAWIHLIQLRDHETEGHSLRVTALALKLGADLHFAERDLITLRRGALLHDIGKLAIPERILYKPAPLTLEEYKIMRQHPIYGFELLSKIDALNGAAEIAHHHHEMWDGSGYPDGLKGERIPLSARIVGLVEVWDALRSDHIYRRAWTFEKSRDYMQEQAGKAFDPNLIQRFMALID